jgi:hypothetical protein
MAMSDAEVHDRYVVYKRGWVVAASKASELDTPEPQYMTDYERGKTDGHAAFTEAMKKYHANLKWIQEQQAHADKLKEKKNDT